MTLFDIPTSRNWSWTVDGRRIPTDAPRGGLILTIHVTGIPTPQGSKRGFVVNGRAVIVDDNKRPLRTWRQDVKEAALAELAGRGVWQLLTDCDVDVTFFLPRPKGHYGTGHNATQLRPAAPRRPTTKPDGDKLLRATLDALRDAGVYRDDANVVDQVARKRYALDHPGALIQIYTGTPT